MKFNKQKAFGQHFLKDQQVIGSIVTETEKTVNAIGPCVLLEIGPGEGAITKPILKSIHEGKMKPVQYWIAEKDFELIELWKEEKKYGAFIHRIIEGDFLETGSLLGDFISESAETKGLPLVVVSNLPYSSGTPILLLLNDLTISIPAMVLMFQAEVSQKLYAGPSTSKRGSLSVYIQNKWDVTRLCKAPPSAFSPPPKVDSEVVVLKKKAKNIVEIKDAADEKTWNDLLRTAFKQRRKMLRGNFSGTRFSDAFQKSGVAPTLRAEALDWPEWQAIWRSLT